MDLLLYTELYPEYAHQFERLGKNFEDEMIVAYHKATKMNGIVFPDEIKAEVILELKKLLDFYKPKRRSGRWFKGIASFLLKIVPYIKIKKK